MSEEVLNEQNSEENCGNKLLEPPHQPHGITIFDCGQAEDDCHSDAGKAHTFVPGNVAIQYDGNCRDEKKQSRSNLRRSIFHSKITK